jgi:nicotinate-nucleotide--dimethylbenzimidazole phosphoribosyltransferase
MGIGNTSPSSLWMHLLLDIPLEQCVGAGAGLNSEGIAHKLDVLKRCAERFRRTSPQNDDPGTAEYPTSIMQELGGLEMNTAVGAMLRATALGMTILVDGFIMSACALMAIRLCPQVRQNAIFCHVGDESGHRLMLDRMGVKPLLSLGLRLGEGTGAVAALPLLDMALAVYRSAGSFGDIGMEAYEKLS